MAKTNTSKCNTSDETINHGYTVLGEFWIDSDGEVFIDPADPIPGLQDAVKLKRIQQFEKKLQKKLNISFATRYSNRRPFA